MTQEAEKKILALEAQLEELRKGRPGQLVVQLGSVWRGLRVLADLRQGPFSHGFNTGIHALSRVPSVGDADAQRPE
jgi:hypothetical protein